MFRRIATLCGLLCCLGVLLVGHGTTGGEGRPYDYSTARGLAADYGDHVGQRVLVTGRVVSVDPTVLSASLPGGPLTLTVEGLDVTVSPGDRVQLYGVAGPDQTIRVHNGVKTGNELYAWTISAVAVLWVAYRALRQWTFDPSSLLVRQRGTVGGVDEGDRPDA